MGHAVSEHRFEELLGSIYDAAVDADRWPAVLEGLASVFNANFADIFTRSHDRQHFSGLAYGLSRADYDDNFLGTWFKRNVWGNTRPVAAEGEVLSTRSIVDLSVFRASAIYNEYLAPRGLHEGLRLALWVTEREVQYVSVLRPWSGGVFGPTEIEQGATLLPHLRRAAAITRRLRDSDLRLRVGGAGERDDIAVVLFDALGKPFWFNAGAEAVLADGTMMRLSGGALHAGSAASTDALRRAVARASGLAGPQRDGGTVVVRREGETASHNVMVLPLSGRDDWATCRPPAAAALLRNPLGPAQARDQLRTSFALTGAETSLAQELLAGRSLQEVALRSKRSVNTVRTHLARLMGKTATNKQSDLLRVLGDVTEFRPAGRLGAAPSPAGTPSRSDAPRT